MATTLSQTFHGQSLNGENIYPGSGGNLNSVYDGSGSSNPQSEDEGYQFGAFPAGALPVGQENQQFRISDSKAFNNLRGIARTNFPFDPYPSQDSPNNQMQSLTDTFQPSDAAGISSLLPGKYNYNNLQGTLSREILNEFDAGTSSYNSLQSGASGNLNDLYGAGNFENRRENQDGIDGIHTSNIVDQHRESFTNPATTDVPLTPFHYVYPNFGTSTGEVDYGFAEPGQDDMSNSIIEAYNAVLPEGELAGTKKDLMPVFSGVNQQAVEQRPMLQSLGKMKNTLYLGGATVLPDELQISPLHPLMAGSNTPANIVQTAGELSSALGYLSYQGADGLSSGNPYGAQLPSSQTLAGGVAPKMNPEFYSYMTTTSNEPLTFSDNDVRSHIWSNAHSDNGLHGQ